MVVRLRALALASLALTVACVATDRPADGVQASSPPASPTTRWTHPFDPFIGFGRSERASLRDETIANWEVFQVEASVADCMARKRFRYWPDPWGFEGFGDLDQVAGDLGVEASPAAVDAGSRNTRYPRRLPRAERDRYYQALYGESAEDVAFFEEGGAPPGRDPDTFLRGGCMGRADREASNMIWDRARRLDREYDRLRNRMRNEGATEEDVVEAFIARNGERLEALARAYPGVETYEDVLSMLSRDERFMTWLTTGRV